MCTGSKPRGCPFGWILVRGLSLWVRRGSQRPKWTNLASTTRAVCGELPVLRLELGIRAHIDMLGPWWHHLDDCSGIRSRVYCDS